MGLLIPTYQLVTMLQTTEEDPETTTLAVLNVLASLGCGIARRLHGQLLEEANAPDPAAHLALSRELQARGLDKAAKRVAKARDYYEHDPALTEDECRTVVVALEAVELNLRTLAAKERTGDA